jgi:hypothetical protein
VRRAQDNAQAAELSVRPDRMNVYRSERRARSQLSAALAAVMAAAAAAVGEFTITTLNSSRPIELLMELFADVVNWWKRSWLNVWTS